MTSSVDYIVKELNHIVFYLLNFKTFGLHLICTIESLSNYLREVVLLIFLRLLLYLRNFVLVVSSTFSEIAVLVKVCFPSLLCSQSLNIVVLKKIVMSLSSRSSYSWASEWLIKYLGLFAPIELKCLFVILLNNISSLFQS